MMDDRQSRLFPEERPIENGGFLGLVVEHRRLLSALETGWLQPPQGSGGHLLRHGEYVAEAATSASSHPIAVRLRLCVDKLPDLELHICRGDQWVTGHLHDVLNEDDLTAGRSLALFWPGALPAFAISALAVATDEQRARLHGMAQATSNVDLSDVPIDVVGEFDCQQLQIEPPENPMAGLRVPDAEDAVRGAITMALWAVPRITPWLDLLQASLSSEDERLIDMARAVDAPWWRFVPWRLCSGPASSPDELLWRGAIRAFRDGCHADACRPRELAERVAECAIEGDCDDQAGSIAAWLDETNRILRTEATIRFESWRQQPVGLAIQLVLTRPEPTAFKTWLKDEPSLPPAVAWSAATLCGLRNGFQRLDTRFRGCAMQRELVSITALSAASPDLAAVRWRNGPLDLCWRREPSGIVFSHGRQDFAHKKENARGMWHAADFEAAEVRNAAAALAARLNWPCIAREAVWEAKPPYADPLAVAKRAQMEQGKVHMPVPLDATLEPTIGDVEQFRRLIATERVVIAEPPPCPTPSPNAGVPGLAYEPNFLTEEEERDLIAHIDAQPWQNDLKRRVQHYGWRYDYKAREVDPSMRLGPLPEWAEPLAQRLFERELVPQVPDQLIVNEYEGNQGISKHIDAVESFADGIAMVSLGDAWEMTFRKHNAKRKVSQLLERRSVAVMQGESRYSWTHEIPNRKNEPALQEGGKRRPRRRRISLTFRKVIDRPADGGDRPSANR